LLTISKAQEKNMNNPFFKVWNTPFNTPPFSQIKIEDFLPAFEEGMKQHKDEIQKIIDSKETPTFQNTIVELNNLVASAFLSSARCVVAGKKAALCCLDNNVLFGTRMI